MDICRFRTDTSSMARTRSTDPDEIRASRRVGNPRENRGTGDASDVRALGRALKELGIPDRPADRATAPIPPPSIRRSRATPGTIHPLTTREIREFLTWLGPIGTYGLFAIALRQRPSPDAMRLATYRAPDTILLYAQPEPPWEIAGRLDAWSVRRIETCGARVTRLATSTTVDFPDDCLRRFMLFEGLAHELGHHIVQQYEGKRAVRKLRTADHEARASAFARACQRRWLDERSD